MTVQAARLKGTVAIDGAAASSAALKGVGREASGAQHALSSMSSFGGVASKSLGLVEKGASGLSNAAGHLKGTIGGLITGPLGFLGLGAGVLGVAGGLKEGIDTANQMALSIEKLTGLTHEDAAAMSGLLAVTGKFNITSDQLATIVGFETKTVEKLATTYVKAGKAGKSAALTSLENQKAKLQEAGASTKVIDKLITEQKARDQLTAANAKALPPLSKLQALQKQYGVTLTDSKGNALDFSQVLNNVSDYWNTAAGKINGAALAAQLFGRGYSVLVPVLQLGSKGFAEAQQAAASLGLTLNNSNERDLMKYQESMRKTGDAVGGLGLQLSLDLIPDIGRLADSATRFIGQNRQGISAWFKGLIADGEKAGEILTGTIIPDIQALAGAAIGFWNKIPEPMRNLIIGGVITQKSVKFLFGIDIAADAKDALGSLFSGLASRFASSVATSTGSSVIGAFAGRGSSALNPLWVTVTGAGGLGTAAEDAGAAGGGGLLATLGGLGLTIGAGIELAIVGYLTDKLILHPTTITSGGGSAGKFGAAPGTYGNPINAPAGAGAAGSPDGPAFANIAAAERGQADAAQRGNAIALSYWGKAIAIWNAVHKVDLEIANHEKAKAAVGGHGKDFHDFLASFRGGGATVAIKDFPKELAYLSTASDATKKTPTFLSSIHQNITALTLAMVGATTRQRTKLSADILGMKALLPKTNATLAAIQAKAAEQLTKLQAIKDKDSSLTLTATLKVDGSTLAKTVLTYAGGKRLA